MGLNLTLQHLNQDRPFILRTDASDRAIGAVLEQLADSGQRERLTLEEVQKGVKTVPVAFFSRKLTTGQSRRWPVREKEVYAVVSALEKWASWIGFQQVLVLTDHRSLEHWATEVLGTPTGPSGRRARWHLLLSQFDIQVGYIPGKDNTVADVMSRYAYPASKGLQDVSFHGNEEDDDDIEKIIAQEKSEEQACQTVYVRPVGDVSDVPRRSPRLLGLPVMPLVSKPNPRLCPKSPQNLLVRQSLSQSNRLCLRPLTPIWVQSTLQRHRDLPWWTLNGPRGMKCVRSGARCGL